jgi:hypothetical protein
MFDFKSVNKTAVLKKNVLTFYKDFLATINETTWIFFKLPEIERERQKKTAAAAAKMQKQVRELLILKKTNGREVSRMMILLYCLFSSVLVLYRKIVFWNGE